MALRQGRVDRVNDLGRGAVNDRNARLVENGVFVRFRDGYPQPVRTCRTHHRLRGGAVRLLTLLVLVWLVIGGIAGWQRGYFGDSEQNCSSLATVATTVVAGPLNYAGVNPQVECEGLPEPSQ